MGNSSCRCYKRRLGRQNVDLDAGSDARGDGKIVHIADSPEERRRHCPMETCWRERKVEASDNLNLKCLKVVGRAGKDRSALWNKERLHDMKH